MFYPEAQAGVRKTHLCQALFPEVLGDGHERTVGSENQFRCVMWARAELSFPQKGACGVSGRSEGISLSSTDLTNIPLANTCPLKP